jgi:hypothetical protein
MATMRKFKVKQQLTGSCKYRPWNKWEEGEYIIGDFQSLGTDNYGKNNYKLKVLETDILELKEGDVVGLNSCGSLDKAMEGLDVGTTVQITYTGQIILEKGKFAGKAAHTCEVAIMEKEGEESLAPTEENDDL